MNDAHGMVDIWHGQGGGYTIALRDTNVVEPVGVLKIENFDQLSCLHRVLREMISWGQTAASSSASPWQRGPFRSESADASDPFNVDAVDYPDNPLQMVTCSVLLQRPVTSWGEVKRAPGRRSVTSDTPSKGCTLHSKTFARRAVQVGALAAGAVLLTAGAASANAGLLTGIGNSPESQDSFGNNGVGNGNQLVAPIQIPINICGNAVAVLGVAGAGCDGGSTATQEDGFLGDQTSFDNNGVGNGNQVQAPIQIPIDICGNAVGVAGVAGAGCDGGSTADMDDDNWFPTEDGDQLSTGNQGVGNGNQVEVPVQAPVDACGNAVGALVGLAGAGCDGGSTADMDDDGVFSVEAETAGVPASVPSSSPSNLGSDAINQGVLGGLGEQVTGLLPV